MVWAPFTLNLSGLVCIRPPSKIRAGLKKEIDILEKEHIEVNYPFSTYSFFRTFANSQCRRGKPRGT